MSERKINLEEILQKHIRFMLEDNGKTIEQSKYLSDKIIKDEDFVYIKNAMKEACKKILELVTENSSVILYIDNVKESSMKEHCIHRNNMEYIYTNDKQSILDTIKQIE